MTPKTAVEGALADTDAIDTIVERSVRDSLANDPERKVSMFDGNGNVVEVRASEILKDLEADETLLREFRSCIA